MQLVWKILNFCLLLRCIFFNFNKTKFYNARDIELH